jgi:PucR C-terminal helix-turn-helix domain
MTDSPGQAWLPQIAGPPQFRDALAGADPADIADDLGSALATLVTSGIRRRPAEQVVIAESERSATIRPGDVILGIGMPEYGLGALHLIRAAAAAKASALILRSARPLDQVAVTEAEASGLTLITVNPRLPWERVYSLVQASIDSRALGSDDGPADDLPLGNMFELATALSRLVGGPTILEDAHFRVIGYSAYTGESDPGRQAAILLRHIPPEWLAYLRSEGVLERLRRTEDVILLERGPMSARRRLITSVRSAGELIGIIWVAEGDHPLDKSSAERLRRARPMTVPHFQRYLATGRIGISRRGELLRCLIEGRGDAARAAQELGVDQASDHCLVAAFPAVAKKPGASATAGRELFAAHLEYYESASVTTVLGDVLYGLAPVSRPSDRERLKAAVARFATEVWSRDLAVVAISTPQPVAGHLTDAQQELHTLLALTPHHADSPLVIAGWENEAAVMAKRAERLLNADQPFRFRKLTALEAYDAKNHSRLEGTLAAYLSTGASVSRAADILQVHQTTLRYRLRRIVEISGLDLDNPAECIAAQLHLLAVGRWPGISTG